MFELLFLCYVNFVLFKKFFCCFIGSKKYLYYLIFIQLNGI